MGDGETLCHGQAQAPKGSKIGAFPPLSPISSIVLLVLLVEMQKIFVGQIMLSVCCNGVFEKFLKLSSKYFVFSVANIKINLLSLHLEGGSHPVHRQTKFC